MTDPTRTPYCHKIRYGISGAPILTDDEMEGSHAPGVGVAPKLIELVYSAPRDGKPATVSASVTGEWTRFGEPDGGQMETHFRNGPDGWPAWLAEEARLHDPATEVERLREKHKASLRRADQINNELMEEVQRYAGGTERPVLWSVYNDMHLRASHAELTLERITTIVRRLAAHAVGFQDVLDDSDREPWAKTVGADIAELLRLAGETPATEPVCLCGHPIRLHHEDVCLTNCGCNDGQEPDTTMDLPGRLQAALTKRFTELGNPGAQMRYHEQGPDGWPASHPVGPRMVAEVLRELLVKPEAVVEARQDGAQQ